MATLAHLLLALVAVSATTSCPEDSALGDDGECRCVSFCPRHDCPAGQQPLMVRPAVPETPGSCCPLYECRDQATLSYVQAEEQPTHCVDQSGLQRESGEAWLDEADPCMDCSCDAGGVKCVARMCRSCTRPLPRQAGECCPGCAPERCPSLLGCDLDCEHGLLMDEDGCDVCQCRPGPLCPAKLFCRRRCPRGYGTEPSTGCPVCRCLGSCTDELNVTHPEGTSWSNEACRSCACEANGQISCNETVCSVACSEPLPPPKGHCCPVCPTTTPNELPLHGWSIVPIVLVAILAMICIVMMIHIVRSRFRARLAPSEAAEFAGFSTSQQYYKCVPVFETHVPVLKHAEKLAPI